MASDQPTSRNRTALDNVAGFGTFLDGSLDHLPDDPVQDPVTDELLRLQALYPSQVRFRQTDLQSMTPADRVELLASFRRANGIPIISRK
jgi:hypothetical protein